MLVHLRQYREDDATDSVRSGGDVDPDRDDEAYFGTDAPGEDWERTEYDGRTVQHRTVTRDGVTAVSLPSVDDRERSDLPGLTVQLRVGGGIEYVESAEVVEATDADPDSPE